MNIHELVYSPEVGYDVSVPIRIDYDPRSYSTKAHAARGLYEALVKAALQMGQRDTEVALQTPEQCKRSIGQDCWRVVWEAGPYEWAIGASFEITGPWGYTEPYYSFDLCFTD